MLADLLTLVLLVFSMLIMMGGLVRAAHLKDVTMRRVRAARRARIERDSSLVSLSLLEATGERGTLTYERTLEQCRSAEDRLDLC